MIDRPVSMLGSVDSILFDNAPVAYSLLDLNGRQIGGNRAYWELFGYDPSEAGSIDVMRLTHPDDRELTRRYFADLLGGQVEETAIEKRYIRKDGSQFLGRLKAKAVKDEIGKPRFLVGVIEDITDAAEANRALREAANAQASFVAAVSHELRSPLHSILGLAELLSFSLSGEDRGRADTIVRQAENLRALIDDILDMSRVQAGVLELRNEDFEYPDLLGAAYEYLIRDFADSAGKKGGEFYTPRSVVRMMVRLAEPQEGMRIYDPCSGSGGM